MNISKNKVIGWSIVGIIVLVGVFFAGASYGTNQLRALQKTQALGAGNFAGRAGGARGAGGFGGMTVGQIIAKDATSITVQLMNVGATTSTTPVGSKIIFLDNNTPITKQANGTLADLAVGTQVSVTGAANADGSMSATAVQIRPATPTRNTTP